MQKRGTQQRLRNHPAMADRQRRGAPRAAHQQTALAACEDNAFKLFSLDVGLLAEQSHPDASILLEGSRKGTAEVGLVLQQGQEVTPIEVKAEENLKAKSFKVYVAKFQPK